MFLTLPYISSRRIDPTGTRTYLGETASLINTRIGTFNSDKISTMWHEDDHTQYFFICEDVIYQINEDYFNALRKKLNAEWLIRESDKI